MPADDTQISPVRIAALRGSEKARLVLVDECLVAVLVRLVAEPFRSGEETWYLQVGFGPWDQEALIFPSLRAAQAWALEQLPAAWSPAAV